jgi:hypothetical protein
LTTETGVTILRGDVDGHKKKKEKKRKKKEKKKIETGQKYQVSISINDMYHF